MTEAPIVTPVVPPPVPDTLTTTAAGQAVRPTITEFTVVDVETLTNLPSDRFRVIWPIPVMVDREGDGVILAAHHLDSFGIGDDVESAAEDLGECLIQLFDTLEENRASLSTHLEDIRLRLSRHMVPVE